eukprot:m.165652 g.165652  ORF g.165652 m.165652 type:complete len:315 (-) comp24007_c1_seq2:993-1937(-)
MAISMANQKVPAWACVVLGVWCLAATLKIMLPQSGAGHEGAVGLVAGPRARVPPHQPDSASSRDSTASALPPWALDERNVRIPRDETGAVLPSAERLRLLELKLGGVSNWAKDPWFGQRVSSAAVCKKESDLAEFGCPPKQACPGLYSHKVCLDNLPRPAPYGKRAPLRPDCVVYDFGIRAQPEFGLIMAESFGCTVHAFDPSPVTTQWFKAVSLPNLPHSATAADCLNHAPSLFPIFFLRAIRVVGDTPCLYVAGVHCARSRVGIRSMHLWPTVPFALHFSIDCQTGELGVQALYSDRICLVTVSGWSTCEAF